MKNILLALSFIALASSTQLNATHVAGGDIQYRYIGDSTGIPRHYEVLVRLYRDASPFTASMPTSIPVRICSNCYATQNINLALFAGGVGQTVPTLFDCVAAGSSGTIPIEYYYYKGYATLPGNCVSFTFSYDLCCRNNAIQNIQAPGSVIFYIRARLNNLYGQNSSPQFVNPPIRNFCVNRSFDWPQTVIEHDGDSLLFKLTNVKSAAVGGCAFTIVNYTQGFTFDQPMTTTPPNGLTIDQNTGLISFTPAVAQIVALSFVVDEYRFDSITSQWHFVGSSSWDSQVGIAPACSPTAQQGVVLDTSNSSIYIHPTTGKPAMDLVCFDSVVQINFASPISCYSISPDGSNYRLLDTNNQPWPIISATYNCNTNNSTSAIILKLAQPINQNGVFKLYSKVGTNGSTLGTICGFYQDEFDTIMINVTGCSGISIDEFEIAKPEIYFPNAFTPNFDGINDYFIIEIPEDARGNFLLEVFNRWGQPVHRTTDTQKLTWDGTQQGKDAASGVYYYTLKHIPTGHSWQGHITLLR